MAKQIDFDADEWGGCPRCHYNDGYLNAPISGGMRQWFWCGRHKLKWRAETNLFSGWQQMPRWLLQRQAILLAGAVKLSRGIQTREFFEKSVGKDFEDSLS